MSVSVHTVNAIKISVCCLTKKSATKITTHEVQFIVSSLRLPVVCNRQSRCKRAVDACHCLWTSVISYCVFLLSVDFILVLRLIYSLSHHFLFFFLLQRLNQASRHVMSLSNAALMPRNFMIYSQKLAGNSSVIFIVVWHSSLSTVFFFPSRSFSFVISVLRDLQLFASCSFKSVNCGHLTAWPMQRCICMTSANHLYLWMCTA